MVIACLPGEIRKLGECGLKLIKKTHRLSIHCVIISLTKVSKKLLIPTLSAKGHIIHKLNHANAAFSKAQIKWVMENNALAEDQTC